MDVIRTRNRNAYARVRNGSVIISLPHSLKGGKADEIALNLYKRLQRDMLKKPEKYMHQGKKEEILFSNGEALSILGRDFRFVVSSSDASNARGRIVGSDVIIKIPASMDQSQKEKAIASIGRRLISREISGKVEERLNAINAAYFGSAISTVRLTNASTKWGSCSTSRRFDGAKILINFKLLFMPEECLDYVIVHELAHTKIHNHSREFWEIIGRVIPDYKERRRVLRDHAYTIKGPYTGPNAAAQESGYPNPA
ncbi:MAG: M48 family metallopeptidase [Candidatus Micrarchaeota archaeon]|nr:M48 family metallopeptidase [Candidatus Micrarchaeota archaeon]